MGQAFLLCLALNAGTCASREEGTEPRAEETPAMEMSLECAMSVTPRVRPEEPVEPVFRLRNPGAPPVYVLNWPHADGRHDEQLPEGDAAERSFSTKARC